MANNTYNKGLSIINIFRKPKNITSPSTELLSVEANLNSFLFKFPEYLKLQEKFPGCYHHFYLKTVIKSKRVKVEKLRLLGVVCDIVGVYAYCKDVIDPNNELKTLKSIILAGQKEDVRIAWAMFRYFNHFSKIFAEISLQRDINFFPKPKESSLALNYAYIFFHDKLKLLLEKCPIASENKIQHIDMYCKNALKLDYPKITDPRGLGLRKYSVLACKTNGKYKNRKVL